MRIIIVVVVLLIGVNISTPAQESFYTAFWNTENLFDTVDDPLTDDSEFLPGSEKKWDQEKFHKKVINIASVIMSMNRGYGPDILGLCEVENKAVVESLLVYLNPGYQIVHKESPDQRGIDNALIFKTNMFKLVSIISDSVDIGNSKTRNILGSRLVFKRTDTLSIFVNHWPSRRGDEDTEQKRIKAALKLKERLTHLNDNDFVIIMGDFNDEPENKSLDSVLNAGRVSGDRELLNLAYEKSLAGEGSYKYRDTWNMLDQIIISDKRNLSNIIYIENTFDIYKPYYIITQTGKYAGTPKPVYGGSRYLGGYSDHFPVTAQFTTGKR